MPRGASGVDADYIAAIGLATVLIIGALTLFMTVVVRDAIRQIDKRLDGIVSRFSRLVEYLEDSRKIKRR
tara:strand:+ start:270 stop:479 length:210 start_codon:yes stop_codon:yes gene_type:complete